MSACTGIAAVWCPNHGDCTCPPAESDTADRALDDPNCPLHSPTSTHAETTR
jgi:hypothetical protein